MDDEIIECFDSTPSAAIIILDKYMESFSSLGSQQLRLARDVKLGVCWEATHPYFSFCIYSLLLFLF